MSRWTLQEVGTAATWTMPINPDSMTSPHPRKDLSFAKGSRRGLTRIRTFKSPPRVVEWEWSGVIRTKTHYDSLEEWAKKEGKVHVTDHLGRTWEVLMQAFNPEDRQPTHQTPWRLRYSMRVYLLRRVS